MNRWNLAGLGLLAAMIVGIFWACAIALLPPPETHPHHSHSDSVTLVPEGEWDPLEAAVEPALDFYALVAPDTAIGHKPFPTYCGKNPAAKPGHYYYPDGSFRSGGKFYRKGLMSHVVGSDYRYTFVCGYKRADGTWKYYKAWPQRWW